MSIRSKIIISTVTIAVVGSGIGVGVAYADPGTPSPAPSASPSAGSSATPSPGGKTAKAGHHRRALERRALHGEATMAGEKHTVVAFQRGTVTAVDGTKITVKSADGFSATYVAAKDTTIRQAKKDLALDQIKVAAKVAVVATKDGSTLTAKRIVVAGH